MSKRQFSFFYAPTWDYPPGGPIKLGNVITSVKNPHRPLFCSPPPDDSDVSRVERTSVEYTIKKFGLGNFSVLTKFLDLIGVGIDVGAKTNRSSEEKFRFETLETIHFVPTSSYIQTCIEDDKVRRYLKLARYRKPVYVITGLKVVTGAQANVKTSRTMSTTVSVAIGVNPAGNGPGVSSRVGNETEMKWENSSDFVFAFRVSKVYVGEAEGQVLSEEEYRKGDLLGHEVEMIRQPALTILRVEEPNPESEGFDTEELMENEDVVICAIPRDEGIED